MNTSLNMDKLGKLLALAGSSNEHEALVAIKKAKEALKAANMTFTDLAATVKSSNTQTVQTGQQQKPTSSTFSFSGFADFMEAESSGWKAAAAAKEAERQHSRRVKRAAVLVKYGSELAAIARDAREQTLHAAALPWLVGPFEPEIKYDYLAGRWHEKMGGWDNWSSGHPVDECRRAIEAALPMPSTIREARDELLRWDERDSEIQHALGLFDDQKLDLPAAYRRDLVRRLYQSDLPVVTMDDLHLRLEFPLKADWRIFADEFLPQCMDAFERLVLNAAQPSNLDSVQSEHPRTASQRRRAMLDLMLDPTTANLSDRAIARRVGVAPTTVGTTRRRLVTAPVWNQ